MQSKIQIAIFCVNGTEGLRVIVIVEIIGKRGLVVVLAFCLDGIRDGGDLHLACLWMMWERE